MYEFIIGRRDEYQYEDNIFYRGENFVSRLGFRLAPPPTYISECRYKSFSVPPELWEPIFDQIVQEYLEEFNFALLAKFLLISKEYMLRFYSIYFGKERLVDQEISDVERYYRISHTLRTLEMIMIKFYNGITHCFEMRLNRHLRSNGFPMPWDVLTVNATMPALGRTTIANLSKNDSWNPNIFQVGQGTCYIDGEIDNSVLRPNYFRLPVVVLSLTSSRSKGPIMTANFLKYSHSWNSIASMLRAGLGRTTGIYHSIKVPTLPHEYVFHEEVLIES